MPSFTPTATGDQPPTEGATSGERDFTFAVCGDNRDGPEVYRQVLERVQEDGSAFLIHTGDLVSYGSEARFQEFARMMQGFRLPFYPVPGNHDNFGGVLTAYLKYSGAPAAHYSFDYGLVHFSLIDTSLGEASKGELDWLAGDLEATDQPAKMVVLHHPPFDPAGTDHIMLRGNKEFMALMVEKGVNLILAGHIHSYDMAERDGVLYMITGGAGAPLYQEPNRPAFHHYVRVKVKGTDLSTEVVRLDKEG
jgi:3',5'-cyclic AMP phosphodiesterase CpdA